MKKPENMILYDNVIKVYPVIIANNKFGTYILVLALHTYYFRLRPQTVRPPTVVRARTTD
jgi:hypothetical protein